MAPQGSRQAVAGTADDFVALFKIMSGTSCDQDLIHCATFCRMAMISLARSRPLRPGSAQLLVSYPEIVEMQARAIFEAAIEPARRCTTG